MSPTIRMMRRPAPPPMQSIPAESAARTSSAYDAEIRNLSSFELADRLVRAWSRNERRLGAMDGLEAGVASARRRLATTTAGRSLVEAHLRRLQVRLDACRRAAAADVELSERLLREWDFRWADRRAVGG